MDDIRRIIRFGLSQIPLFRVVHVPERFVSSIYGLPEILLVLVEVLGGDLAIRRKIQEITTGGTTTS